jgi:AraC family transcriptional regulator, transcriptional activator of the genes for pyochelin and ferripyochelin receptors
MTVILTDAQYDEQFNADELREVAKEIFCHSDREEISYYYDAYTRNGCDRYIQLRHGLQLRIWSFESLQDLIITNDRDINKELSLSFFLAGDMHTHLHGLTEQITEAEGNSYLMYCQGVTETEGWKAHQKILRLKVIVEPAKFFEGMSLEEFDGLPHQLKQFATQETIAPFYLQNAIAPEITPILQQILNCPYNGVMKQWYLEAKALEAIILQFSHIQEPTSNLPDLEPIYQAKEILLQNWLDPPSILELAGQVGIYHMKLKQGFKQVFGTTPFNYLREYRLEKARQLLQDRKLTIVAVANAVGYANPGHFAAAFKRKYGMTPKEVKFK